MKHLIIAKANFRILNKSFRFMNNVVDKKILILKTGNTIKGLLEKGKDFEDWFVDCSGLAKNVFIIRSLHLGESLVDLSQIAAIIITGSPAFITDEETWNFIGASYIREAHGIGIPILGVCYGHQLLAWTFGGKVAFNEEGRNIGTITINLKEPARNDLLFGGLPERFNVNVSHQQSVVELPSKAIELASSNSNNLQAFRLGETSWGVQFHPEFSKDIVRKYIEERSIKIKEEGLDPEMLASLALNTPNSVILFQRFCHLAKDKKGYQFS